MPGVEDRSALAVLLDWIRDRMPVRLKRTIRRMQSLDSPRVGKVQMGDLNRATPVARHFGFGRGTPVDRFYIERFLSRWAADIRGRVLEVGDDSYSRRFGSDITGQEVLTLHRRASTTIAGDLAAPGTLPEGVFDCVILTQTLQHIFDLEAGVARLRSCLAPGGVILATVPGVSPVDYGKWVPPWFWSLTRTSVERLFGEAFGPENIEVQCHGNVYAATCFLQGLALEETDRQLLESEDDAYAIVISVRARAPA